MGSTVIRGRLVFTNGREDLPIHLYFFFRIIRTVTHWFRRVLTETKSFFFFFERGPLSFH